MSYEETIALLKAEASHSTLEGMRRFGIESARAFFILSSPSGGFGIGNSAASDISRLGFAKPINFNYEWWEDFY